MGGSPPPGSKKGGYKPVVRSCVENINGLHFALLHVRDAEAPARGRRSIDGTPRLRRGRRSVDARDAKFVYTGQYGERICDYYLGALELPKPSDPK